MSIDQTGVVDLIGVDNKTGDVVLTITDHLPWESDVNEHLLLLQEKINAYLSFVESGEIEDAYPDAVGRSVVIQVAGKFELEQQAKLFYSRAESIVKGAGMQLRFLHVVE